MTGKSTPYINIYISSAPEDQELLRELKKQLSVLKREADILLWDKEESIVAGTNRQQQIATYIGQAHLILLLLSSDFLDDCYDEMEQVTRRMRNMEDVHVIPILMRRADWRNTPIRELQPLPTDQKPVNDRADREKALGDIVEHIRHIIEQKRLKSSNDVRLHALPTQSGKSPFGPPNEIRSYTPPAQSGNPLSHASLAQLGSLPPSTLPAQPGNLPYGPSPARSPMKSRRKVGLISLVIAVALLLTIVIVVSRTFGPSELPPQGNTNDPAASSIVTTIQMASAVDKTSKLPTTLTTSFRINADIYTTFRLNLNGVEISKQHPGYVQARYYSGQRKISTSHVLTIDGNTISANYFPPFHYFDATTAGAVEVYWCREKDCGDAKLAQKASFTVS